MRLLIVSHLFRNPLEHSKLPNLFDLTQSLSKDADVEVIAPVPWFPPFRFAKRWYKFSQIPKETRYGRVRVRYPRHLVFPRRILYVLSGRTFLRALRRSIRGERYDVVWAHYAFPDGWAAVRMARSSGMPVFVTVRGDDVRSDIRHAGVRSAVVETLREADVVTSPHPETTDLARRLFPREIVELHNGVDISRFAHGDGRPVREELRLNDEFVVTFVGHLVEFKDPRTFLEAAAIVPSSERVAFLVVGTPGRGREQGDLAGLVEKPGIQDRVRFLGDRDDVPNILAASDCFVAVSPVENIWSNTILEAMAAGVPCIVTRVGTTEKFLRDEDQALLIPPKDPPALAAAILRLKVDAQLRNRLVVSGRALVADSFSLESVASRAAELCRSWVGRSHNSTSPRP